MQFRDHPLMSRRDLPSWPPVWLLRGKIGLSQSPSLRGEIGVVTCVVRSDLVRGSLFLYMRENEKEYIGCLMMDDPTFCQHLYELLKMCIGKSIKEIGDIDLNYLG